MVRQGAGAHVAVYGWGVEHEHFDALVALFDALASAGWQVQLYEPMAAWLHSHFGYVPEYGALFTDSSEMDAAVRFMLSVGGDGTFLDSAQYVVGRPIPIVGINFGHLGFLTSAQTADVQRVVEWLADGQYSVEYRSMLVVAVRGEGALALKYALNDVTFQKSEKSMLVINTHIDGQFLCSYWCDGLIVSTPTGSTAYSLSVGAPIVVPHAQTMLLSPIAPHNLSMRPLVLADTSKIHLRAVSRDRHITLGVDAHTYRYENPLEVTISRAVHGVEVVRFANEDFYKALRDKLNWGGSRS